MVEIREVEGLISQAKCSDVEVIIIKNTSNDLFFQRRPSSSVAEPQRKAIKPEHSRYVIPKVGF